MRALRAHSALCGTALSTTNAIGLFAVRAELDAVGTATVSATACANRARRFQKLSTRLQRLCLTMIMNKRFYLKVNVDTDQSYTLSRT